MEEQVSMTPAPAGVRPPALREDAPLEPLSMLSPPPGMRAPTARELAAVVFRHLRLIAATFLAIVAAVVAGTWMLPVKYEASMKILVKRERVDPVVTAQLNAQSTVVPNITEADLNSEVQLITSHDLLEKVVVSCGLHKSKTSSRLARLLGRTSGGSPPGGDIPEAVALLGSSLTVEPIPKSTMIEITYEARDPKLAAAVLQSLSTLYLDKHLAVHRPPGALDFFQQQTDQYQKGLAEAEKELAQFRANENVVSVEIEKDITLRKLSDFESQLREAQVAGAALQQRIKTMEAQVAATPERVVTQVRNMDNSNLLQQLRSTLLSLQLKRTELLTKYEPGYRAVQEVDAQIAQTREAVQQAEKNTLREETTDLDKTRQGLQEELSRARSEDATLRTRAVELGKVVAAYRQSASQIGRREIEHTDLLRAARTAEENYLLYLRKQEEARISDALDRKRIVNVVIAEAATEPAAPSSPNWYLNLVLGFTLATLTSLGLAFLSDHLNDTFRTPDEVERFLGVPIVACLPRN